MNEVRVARKREVVVGATAAFTMAGAWKRHAVTAVGPYAAGAIAVGTSMLTHATALETSVLLAEGAAILAAMRRAPYEPPAGGPVRSSGGRRPQGGRGSGLGGRRIARSLPGRLRQRRRRDGPHRQRPRRRRREPSGARVLRLTQGGARRRAIRLARRAAGFERHGNGTGATWEPWRRRAAKCRCWPRGARPTSSRSTARRTSARDCTCRCCETSTPAAAPSSSPGSWAKRATSSPARSTATRLSRRSSASPFRRLRTGLRSTCWTATSCVESPLPTRMASGSGGRASSARARAGPMPAWRAW